MTATDPPDGFVRHFRQSGLTDPWEPLYSRTIDQAVILGLRAGPAHVNSRGFVHGGLISALADNAMGLSCSLATGTIGGLVTVSLAIDFIGIARVGEWLSIETEFVRPAKTLCFAQCFVRADGAICARGNAVFRVITPVPAPPRRLVEPALGGPIP